VLCDQGERPAILGGIRFGIRNRRAHSDSHEAAVRPDAGHFAFYHNLIVIGRERIDQIHVHTVVRSAQMQ
jgi:hypothetical protein